MLLTLIAQTASRTIDPPVREPFSLATPLVLLVVLALGIAVTALIRSRRRDEDIA